MDDLPSYKKALRVIQVQDEDLEQGDISNLKRVFERIVRVPKHAKLLRGNVAITFPKYDNDPKAIYLLDDVRRYIQLVDAEFPYFLYFLELAPELEQTFLWTTCLLPVTHVEQHENKVLIGLDSVALVILLVERIHAIEMFCEQILDESTSIIDSILKVQSEEVAVQVIRYLKLLDYLENE
jgi:hypothetical protein